MKKGAIAAGILGILLGAKAGRGIGGTSLKLGSLAAIGALAHKGLQKWRAGCAEDTTTEAAPVEQFTGPQAEQLGLTPELVEELERRAHSPMS